MAHGIDPIAEPALAGVDLSLIDESLGYSYEQRAEHHQRALNIALELERVGRELRERHQQHPQAPLRR
jgi:hypothetical protein